MSLIDAAMWSLHVGFAALWTGSVLFVAAAVIPPATRGDVGEVALGHLVGRLRLITRISAVAFVVSGGHMAAQLYTAETLTGGGDGHLVLAMMALWLVITGLVEGGGSKVASGLDAGKLREPARDAKPFLYGAAGLSVLLLAIGGLLANPLGL